MTGNVNKKERDGAKSYILPVSARGAMHAKTMTQAEGGDYMNKARSDAETGSS
jgi:hypothetical protein